MSAPTFNTRSSLTGKLQRLTEDQIRPFQNVLQIVPDDAKPYEPGMFRPGQVGEFDNPEPTPDAVAEAQAAYDALIADGQHPNTAVVRDAKRTLEEATAAAEAELEAANEATEQIQNGEQVEALPGQVDGAPANSEEGPQ